MFYAGCFCHLSIPKCSILSCFIPGAQIASDVKAHNKIDSQLKGKGRNAHTPPSDHQAPSPPSDTPHQAPSTGHQQTTGQDISLAHAHTETEQAKAQSEKYKAQAEKAKAAGQATAVADTTLKRAIDLAKTSVMAGAAVKAATVIGGAVVLEGALNDDQEGGE